MQGDRESNIFYKEGEKREIIFYAEFRCFLEVQTNGPS